MPDFERILDELEKFMASDDPIKLSFLGGATSAVSELRASRF